MSGRGGEAGTNQVAPLILTAALPPALHARLTALRTAHFPPERNYLEAHVTLFHALPGFADDELRGVLARLASEFAPVPARLSGIVSLGRGTAVRIDSAPLLALRALIARHFHGMLSAQDDQRPRLHVTIQNKVSGAAAKALQEALAGQFEGEDFAFQALELFAYRGGPWEALARYPLRGRAQPSG